MDAAAAAARLDQEYDLTALASSLRRGDTNAVLGLARGLHPKVSGLVFGAGRRGGLGSRPGAVRRERVPAKALALKAA